MTAVDCFLSVPIFDRLADPRLLTDLAVEAEAAGWDGFYVWDHIQYRAPVEEVTDPWTAMAAVAHATRSIRFGPMVTPLPRRRPQVLARQMVALDRLSGGRFVLGAGLGLDQSGRELSAFGEQTDDRTRGRMLDESLELLGRFLSGERFTHVGEFYRAEDVCFRPTPVNGHIPVWLAARYPYQRPLRRAARHDGVVVIDLEHPDQLAETVESLGRYGAGPDFTVAKYGAPGDDPDPWVAGGCNYWGVFFDPFTTTPEQVRAVIAEGPPLS